ncbi:MAG: bifunctional riboflavin kinase/FAD synthetase [Phenylobacterium sp.]
MRVITGWKDLPEADRGASVALGNFDGIHLGHQQVIALAAEAAGRLDAALGVISFDPHPRTLFNPGQPHYHLMTRDQQIRVLAGLGVQRLYLLPFDMPLARLSDREFATQVVHDGLGARHVAVGFDNTFGWGRTGSPQTMRQYGAELGFGVSVAEAYGGANADKFSSTAVREALREGRPQDATAILGRPFAIEGTVHRGRQLGRELGYPTANVGLGDYVVPKFGVYATRTRLRDGREFAGVANVGVNPTVGEVAPRLEVWMFDFDEDIYGQIIETDLLHFLRPEQKFATIGEMTVQVMDDAAEARRLLAWAAGD